MPLVITEAIFVSKMKSNRTAKLEPRPEGFPPAVRCRLRGSLFYKARNKAISSPPGSEAAAWQKLGTLIKVC